MVYINHTNRDWNSKEAVAKAYFEAVRGRWDNVSKTMLVRKNFLRLAENRTNSPTNCFVSGPLSNYYLSVGAVTPH